MVEEELLSTNDYNWPIVQIYKYNRVAHVKGAEKNGRMLVEFAATLRVEFIPEGGSSGPVKDIYFKIFKKGTCGIVGAVLGWPTLDHPVVPGGEGLAWNYRPDGAEFKALGATIPRLRDMRKTNYNASVSRYTASEGQLMAIDDVTGDRVQMIDEEGARMMRAALMMANQVPFAQMEPVGLEFFSLNQASKR